MAGRLVVGIDGSSSSAAALEWAVDRARRGGESLELVGTYTLPPMDFYGYTPDASPLEWFSEHTRGVVGAAAARVRALAPEVEVVERVELGPAAIVMTEIAQGADALVVGRRGLGPARSVLLGSVSNQVTVQAGCPVVVVGDHDLVPASGPVVVGVDGSEFSIAALHFALREAQLRETGVRIVTSAPDTGTAVGPDPELTERMQAAVVAEAAAVSAQALELAGAANTAAVPVETVVDAGDPAAAILKQAQDAQLIVVGSHGKGFLRRLLLGSVSREVLQSADRPVAVIDLPTG